MSGRKAKILGSEDLADRNTVRLARNLIGKLLVVGGREIGPIVETEAYDGPEDRASHARRGPTARNAPMFGPPGHWYVYLCYGIHEMLNLVTGPEGYPAAILIRGAGGIVGPGRLTKQAGIDRSFNGLPALPASGLHIADTGRRIAPGSIIATPRIGVAYAGPDWASRPYRFILQDI